MGVESKHTRALKITSCLSAGTDITCREITEHVAERLGIEANFVGDISCQERELLLDSGRIQVGWVCGLLYAWKAARDNQQMELLAAPVMRGARYQGRPIYFSDVVVRRDSRFRSFADLRGRVWAYNEPRSYSGYYLVWHHLARLGESASYFGKVVESGTHLNSLNLVISGKVDAAAIDSTVLDCQLQKCPELRSQIRVITILGPSPIPPWVVFGDLPAELRERLRQLLFTMHEDPKGRTILSDGQLTRFGHVSDRDYDDIRLVVRTVEMMRL